MDIFLKWYFALSHHCSKLGKVVFFIIQVFQKLFISALKMWSVNRLLLKCQYPLPRWCCCKLIVSKIASWSGKGKGIMSVVVIKVCESICNVELVCTGVYVRVIMRICSGPGKFTNATVLVTPDVN